MSAGCFINRSVYICRSVTRDAHVTSHRPAMEPWIKEMHIQHLSLQLRSVDTVGNAIKCYEFSKHFSI